MVKKWKYTTIKFRYALLLWHLKFTRKGFWQRYRNTVFIVPHILISNTELHAMQNTSITCNPARDLWDLTYNLIWYLTSWASKADNISFIVSGLLTVWMMKGKGVAYAATDKNPTLIKLWYKAADRFNLMTKDNSFSSQQMMKCVS